MKEFDWLVDLFSEHNVPEIYVPTSAIRLSKSLCKALEKVNDAAIVTSVDSGFRKTFETVKGTKFYNVVWKNLAEYLKHARLKKFIIPKFILFTNYNDTANEVEQWLKKCKDIGFVEVQFDSEHSVSSSENCENKKYVNRTLKMLEYTNKLSQKYDIKVNSYLAFMNRTHKIYQEQLKNEDKYEYSIVSENDFSVDELDKLVKDEKFSPNRKFYITLDKKIDLQLSEKLMAILRLGFDFDIKISNFIDDDIIEEILKTSNSQVTYMYSRNNLIDLFYKFKLSKKYENIVKIGNIVFSEK